MKFLSKILIVLFVLPIAVYFTSCGKDKNEIKTTYDITCELDGNIVCGVEKFTFYNTYDNAFKELKFNLFANAFRKGAKYSPVSDAYYAQSYYSGESFGSIEILSVTGENCENFSICGEDENILSVTFKNEIFPSESVQLTIEFKTTLANIVARTGINKKTINLANFYPILCAYDNGFYECVYYAIGDPFFSECANYNVNFTCDSEYVVASSGKIIKSTEKDGKRTNCYKIDGARSFSLCLSKDFEILTCELDATQINYYYYKDKTPQKSLEYAEKALKYFSKTFGKYPYKTYSVVETEFVQGGMEFPALVYISDDLEEGAYGEVIVHETAHQWWQSVVGNNEIEQGFLDEGLAEYSVVLFYENYPEYKYERKQLIDASYKTYQIFCSVYDKLFGKVNTVMLRSLSEFASEYEYVNMAYVKPCIMLDTLRKTVGDERFFKGLKRYYEEYSFKVANVDCLVGVYENLGSDASGLFDSFLNGKVIL